MDRQSRAVEDDDAPMSAFEELVRARWPRSKGGIRGLAKAIGSSTETVYAWFRGDNEPNMGHLSALAEQLGVRRSLLVAALDGDPDVALDPSSVEARLRAVEAAIALLGLEAGEALQERRVPQPRAGSGAS